MSWLSLGLSICPNICLERRPNQQYFSCFNYTECTLDVIPSFPVYLLQCKQGQQAGCCYPSKNKFLFAASMAQFHRNPNQFSGTEVINSNLIFPLKLKPSKNTANFCLLNTFFTYCKNKVTTSTVAGHKLGSCGCILKSL